jgi:hypothetical protein
MTDEQQPALDFNLLHYEQAAGNKPAACSSHLL